MTISAIIPFLTQRAQRAQRAETPVLPQRAMLKRTKQLIPGVIKQKSLGNNIDDTELVFNDNQTGLDIKVVATFSNGAYTFDFQCPSNLSKNISVRLDNEQWILQKPYYEPYTYENLTEDKDEDSNLKLFCKKDFTTYKLRLNSEDFKSIVTLYFNDLFTMANEVYKKTINISLHEEAGLNSCQPCTIETPESSSSNEAQPTPLPSQNELSQELLRECEDEVLRRLGSSLINTQGAHRYVSIPIIKGKILRDAIGINDVPHYEDEAGKTKHAEDYVLEKLRDPNHIRPLIDKYLGNKKKDNKAIKVQILNLHITRNPSKTASLSWRHSNPCKRCADRIKDFNSKTRAFHIEKVLYYDDKDSTIKIWKTHEPTKQFSDTQAVLNTRGKEPNRRNHTWPALLGFKPGKLNWSPL
ncbi:MAG: hypothetical protein CMP21_08555 [Rickettsiales bacterium]|nr:hypothetical protein [Rickettsiales bacterium]|tara:strand:+ start:354 stop:1589 length:1236 start_codon:yes stop_codon:yes gene_type:complete